MSLISNLWSRLTGAKATPAEQAHVMATKLLKEVKPAFIRPRPGPLSKTVITNYRLPVDATLDVEGWAKFFSRNLISHAGWTNLAILQESDVHELPFSFPRSNIDAVVLESIRQQVRVFVIPASMCAEGDYVETLPTLVRRYENADGSKETYTLRHFTPVLLTETEEQVTIVARFQAEYEMTSQPSKVVA
jgi:hypothetical protein